MAEKKHFKQLRYFGENDPRNSAGIVNSNIFYDTKSLNYYIINDKLPPENGDFTVSIPTIKHLGIQTIPGVKFYINEVKEPIIIGQTGIFELDLFQYPSLTINGFKVGTLDFSEGSNCFLIIDLVYITTQ